MKKSTLASLGIAISLLLTGCVPKNNGGDNGGGEKPAEKNDGSLEKPFNVLEAIQECDDAGSGVVVNYECYVTGTFDTGTTYNSQYSQWNGTATVEGKTLKLDSLTVPSTMKIAPEDGRLDGTTFVVQGYLELYNGVYKLGYLPATASPTGKKYNPTIYSINGSTNYENMEGYESEVNKFVSNFVDGSGVVIPELPDADDYEGYIEPNFTAVGWALVVYCTDTKQPGNGAMEDIYKAKIEAANWVCTNDEDYTYENYGYLYADPDNKYEATFYTYGGQFAFSLAELEANYSGLCYDLGNDTGYEWYEPYVEYGYSYSKTLPTAVLAEYCEVEESALPEMELPIGCVYYEDEDYGFIEVDLFGCDVYEIYYDVVTSFETFYDAYDDLICYDEEHSYVFEFVATWYGYYALYFYNIATYNETELTDATEWSEEDLEVFESMFGTNTVPFMAFGADYEVFYEEGLIVIQDSYYLDLTADYAELLVADGYVATVVDEDDPTYAIYAKEYADGTTSEVELWWAAGNIVVFYVTPVASEIILSDEEVELAIGETYQIEYEFGPEYCLEPEDPVTFASDDDNITVSEEGLVTVLEDAAIGETATITVVCGVLEATLLVTVVEETAGTGEWVLVTDASDLEAGDKIVLACTSENAISGGRTDKSKYLDAVSGATFEDGKITSEVPETSILVLGGEEDKWTLKLGELSVSASADKNIFGGSTTWTISIDSETGAATIASSNENFGKILYNTAYQRFVNSKSGVSTILLLPEIYKLA